VGGFAPLDASGFRLCGLGGKMASFRKSPRTTPVRVSARADLGRTPGGVSLRQAASFGWV
jgi:hypothetical protein